MYFLNYNLSTVGDDMMFDNDQQENENHIQFQDVTYRKRRQEIAMISKTHIFGQNIPTVQYTELEQKTWIYVYSKMKKYHQFLCPQFYKNHLKMLEDSLGIHQKIPQLQDLDQYINSRTGFRIKTAQGLLSQREFLNALAHRVFLCTQYIRHHQSPEFTPEPDLIHEVIGHIPQLAEPIIADICQQIGLLSIGAPEQELKKLGNLFFFAIEFGAFLDNGEIKGFGAGIASSIGESENFLSGRVKFEKFNPYLICMNTFPSQNIQSVYYYSESLEDNLQQFIQFGKSIQRPFNISYNQQIQEIVCDRPIIRQYKNNNRPSLL